MNKLKSITSWCSCIKISILFFVMTFFFPVNGIVANYKYKQIIHDLPAETDLDFYLNALEKAVNFGVRHKLYVDLNLQFGMFLVDERLGVASDPNSIFIRHGSFLDENRVLYATLIQIDDYFRLTFLGLQSDESATQFNYNNSLYYTSNFTVNLKSYLQEKRYIIPAKTYVQLEQLLLKTDELANYFHSMVEKNKDVKAYKQDIIITQLFHNATTWPRLPEKFNIDLLNKTKLYSPEQLKRIYGKWENYYNSVNDYDKYKPSPKESDECIEFLAKTPPLRSPADCRASSRCKKGVHKGSEFGYGLSHRILFMAIARFSRMCIVFSEKVDKAMTDKFCRRSFYEAQFIALNKLQLPDLMYEHIALCGLFGHAQFLRNSWLKKLLRFQTPEGCFSDTIAPGQYDGTQMREGEGDEWQIANPMYIMNGQCNGHFTAVGAATLSHALRYIIETHY